MARLLVGGLVLAGGATRELRAQAPPQFEVLHRFAGGVDDGAEPTNALVLARDNNLYSTTSRGGSQENPGNGTVYRLNPRDGGYQVLHHFAGGPQDGAEPSGALALAPDGRLYGTTRSGGSGDYGTIYRLGPRGGGCTLVHAFAGPPADGAHPAAGLVLAPDGNFYGTTYEGGSGSSGVIYRLGPQGDNYQVVYSFAGKSHDGASPCAALVPAPDGNLYGTTEFGGSSINSYGLGYGTVYQLNPRNGAYKVVHFFAGSHLRDGANPRGGLVLAPNGNLYGTTDEGGSGDFDAESDSADGTIYRLIPQGGIHKVVHNFNFSDGTHPLAGLVLAPDGNLYGTASADGIEGDSTIYRESEGTIYRFDPRNAGFALVHLFHRNNTDNTTSDGSNPATGLTLASDGNLYGTTTFGGAVHDPNESGQGTIYRLIIVPPPEVTSPLSASGQVGQPFRYRLRASHQPTRFAASALPADLSLDDAGRIRGVPAVAGSFAVLLTATNAAGSGQATLELTVAPAPVRPRPTISCKVLVPAASRASGRPAVVKVRRAPTADPPAEAVTVAYTVGGSAVGGVDYQTLSGRVTIPTGKRFAQIKVKPIERPGAPEQATVVLTLSPATDDTYTLGTPTTAELIIRPQP